MFLGILEGPPVSRGPNGSVRVVLVAVYRQVPRVALVLVLGDSQESPSGSAIVWISMIRWG